MTPSLHIHPTRSGLLRSRFQRLIGSKKSDLFVLTNHSGVEICVTSHGARIVSWLAPDREGNPDDIVLGYDNVQSYIDSPEPYFGAAIGHYANRIARGRFTLDGAEYRIPVNDGPNTLHGGPGGFHAVVWDTRQPDARTLEFTRLFPDGEQGFPGNLRVKMLYALADDNALAITYEATADKPTVVNFTNHTFFNLDGAGSGDIGGHLLTIHASRCTPTDATHIPTGKIVPVAGTPYDFRQPAPIGVRRGLNFVLDRAAPAARVMSLKTGRGLEVLTDQPGLQLYCADKLAPGVTGKSGRPYPPRSALCLETQHFPDSPNQPAFPSTVLRPGETHRHTCIYKTFVE